MLQEGVCLVNNQNLLVILTVIVRFSTPSWAPGAIYAYPQMVAGSFPRPSIIVSLNPFLFFQIPLTLRFPAFAAIYRVGSSVFCVSWGRVLEEGERTLRRESHSQIREKRE